MAHIQRQSRLRCTHSNRGCSSVFNIYAAFALHLEECGFAPVQCTYEGCEATVNKQNLVSHQQSCEFRSVTCHDCRETMRQREYTKHNCVLQRELTELTRKFRDMEARQLGQQTSETTTAAIAQGSRHNMREQGGGLIQFEETQIQQVVTRRLGSEFIAQQPNASRRQQGNLHEFTPSSMPIDVFGAPRPISSATQSQATVNKQIFVAGGYDDSIFSSAKSYEVFDWSTQQWTLYEDALFFDHRDGFSFIYDNKVMLCGGTRTDRAECLNIANSRSVCTLPVQLPGKNCGKGVLCGDKILTFGESISASSLKPPFKTTVLVYYGEGQEMPREFGTARVNENAVILVGGCKYDFLGRVKEWKDDVLQYNTATSQLKALAPLPYRMSSMGVVVHNDNIILLGGCKEYGGVCNDVLMYNVTNQQCSKLPSMLEKRSNFAAVILGDIIIAMGGLNEKNNWMKTAEYLVLGEDTWKKLPPMHRERYRQTACVIP